MIVSNQITFIGLVSSKNYYRRPSIIIVITYGWDTTGWNKFGREYRDGLEGNSWDCHRASSRNLNASMDEAFSVSWQFVPVRDYSNAEIMQAATGFTVGES